ncbi:MULTISPECIES: hypothetical protein [unclassified Streptomyces]|uniref:hypothetical protein n=1 Tax=unclassified Streptomyces TaxID=2593676 RepID=UPI00115F9673|nr:MULTISPECIES: hypothetical protein [unclassified Streptomyces]
MQCPRCGAQMSQTAGGSWQCWTCGNTHLRARTPAAAEVECPHCRLPAVPGTPGWYRCSSCRWEIDEESQQVYADLVARLGADPDRFFADVQARTAHLRALEPAWT